MGKKREFDHESFQDSTAVCAYLETIISGIRSGELKLAEGEEELSLKPCGLMRFEVKATERSDRNKLTLRLSWSTDQEPPPGSDSLSISAG